MMEIHVTIESVQCMCEQYVSLRTETKYQNAIETQFISVTVTTMKCTMARMFVFQIKQKTPGLNYTKSVLSTTRGTIKQYCNLCRALLNETSKRKHRFCGKKRNVQKHTHTQGDDRQVYTSKNVWDIERMRTVVGFTQSDERELNARAIKSGSNQFHRRELILIVVRYR